MQRAFNLVYIIVCGLILGWMGYWVGHWAGWSENAEWPAKIGGGTGAMALSVAFAIVGIVAGAVSLSLGPYLRMRRLLVKGVSARAKVVTVERAGLTLRSLNNMWEKIDCTLEVQPAEGTPFTSHARQFASKNLEPIVRPGEMVEVRYDPVHPSRAVVVERS